MCRLGLPSVTIANDELWPPNDPGAKLQTAHSGGRRTAARRLPRMALDSEVRSATGVTPCGTVRPRGFSPGRGGGGLATSAAS
jgi:hypothetical protein